MYDNSWENSYQWKDLRRVSQNFRIWKANRLSCELVKQRKRVKFLGWGHCYSNSQYVGRINSQPFDMTIIKWEEEN